MRNIHSTEGAGKGHPAEHGEKRGEREETQRESIRNHLQNEGTGFLEEIVVWWLLATAPRLQGLLLGPELAPICYLGTEGAA